MDLQKFADEHAANTKITLSVADYSDMQSYFNKLLGLVASQQLPQETAVTELLKMITEVNQGDIQVFRQRIMYPEQTLNGGNWPSKTGNPSGGNRGNAPAR
ncbi:hypothetical protein ACT7V1_001226 [Salmonella enterica subsp. enterica]|nr:hypothetical protein [Citrobacter freundii]QLO06641.1 hypothetical protein HV141_24410 [Citrobacter freundii]